MTALWRLSQVNLRNSLKPTLETLADAVREDELRIRNLAKVRSGTALEAVLQTGVVSTRTLASSIACLTLRQRFSGQMINLHAGLSSGTETALGTLIPSNGEIDAEDLPGFDFSSFKNRFLSQLNRAGARDGDGFLVAVAEGEYIYPADIYRLHWHIYATGEKVDAVRSLKGLKAYKPRPRVKTPHRMNEVVNPTAQLPYLLKSFWPARWEGFDEEGKPIRSRTKTRIPEEREVEVLLKLHETKITDVILLMGLRIKEGMMKPS